MIIFQSFFYFTQTQLKNILPLIGYGIYFFIGCNNLINL